MPIYVYKNLTTGERFEIEQRITEPALEEHPETGDPVKRLIQPVGIAFKGSGFYATDSRASSRSAPASASSSETATGESTSGDAAADSKTPKTEVSKTEVSKDSPKSPVSSSSKDKKA